MNKSVLLKKLNEEHIIYTLDDKRLTIQCGEFGIISITMDSDYYLFHLIFKVVDDMKRYEYLELN